MSTASIIIFLPERWIFLVEIIILDPQGTEIEEPNSEEQYRCIDRPRSPTNKLSYLQIHANGGLNQMRTAHIERVESLPPHLAGIKPLKGTNFLSVNNLIIFTGYYYRNEMVPLLKKHKVMRFNVYRFSFNLYNNDCSSSIQRLSLSHELPGTVATTIEYFAINCCSYNLTKAETKDLKEMRYRRKGFRRMPNVSSREAALFLKTVTYPSTTTIYIVAGPIYGSGSIDALISEQARGFDYVVALESDAFVLPFYDGNMAKAVQGHRMLKVSRKSINPTSSLISWIMVRLHWEDFSSEVKELHKNRVGAPYRRQVGESPRLEENFYANPYGCVCETAQLKLIQAVT
ncbi:hypothetical protein MKW92_038569 [Papaver armeniacum]|nr:hypothetical protein MKW92_038569 [Papaver armeniacum]